MTRALLSLLLTAQTWTVGSRVHANASVCARADTAQTTCGTLRVVGDKGTLVQGPAGGSTVYGVSWYVDYDTPPDGWSTKQYLALDSLAVADTVNRSWTLGLRVKTTGSAVYVRVDSTCCSLVVDTLPVGIKGTLVGGPWIATDNGVRWKVTWDARKTGWSRQELMKLDSTVSPPPPAPVASVVVTPAFDTLLPTQTVQLTATLRDANGGVLIGRSVTWSPIGGQLVSVSATGLVTANLPGLGGALATSEGKQGDAKILVLASPPPPPTGTTILPRVTALKNLAPAVGFTQGISAQVVAMPVDSVGDLLGNVVTWTVADSTVVAVTHPFAGLSQGAALSGLRPGQTTVTASVGSVTARTTVIVSAPDTTVVTWSVGGIQVPSLPSLRHFTLPIVLTLWNQPCYTVNFTAPGRDSVVATTNACIRKP